MTSTDTPVASQSFIEHVLLCIRVRLEGRSGVVLLDPGYHVPRPITVMEDGLPPQSGSVFTATTRSDVTRSYRYYYPSNSKSYVVWEAEERRGPGGEKTKLTRNLIHVSSPYLSGVDVTERRNLAYTFKTLMGRNAMGDFTGGLYFMVKRAPTRPLPSSQSSCSESSSSSPEFSLKSKTSGDFTTSVSRSSSFSSTAITLLHKVNGEMKSVKKTLAYFLPPDGEEHDKDKLRELEETDEEVEEIVRKVEAAVGRRGGNLRNALTTLASLLHDHAFVSDLFDLEDDLKALGEP